MHKSIMLKALSENLMAFLGSEAGGYKLLAMGCGPHPHPQDLAALSQSAYTYYFRHAMSSIYKTYSFKLLESSTWLTAIDKTIYKQLKAQ